MRISEGQLCATSNAYLKGVTVLLVTMHGLGKDGEYKPYGLVVRRFRLDGHGPASRSNAGKDVDENKKAIAITKCVLSYKIFAHNELYVR